MTRSSRLALLAAVALGATAATAAVASSRTGAPAIASTTITPQQAREAALRAYPGATAAPAAESVERETEGGRAVYAGEVATDMDVLIDPSGRIVETDED